MATRFVRVDLSDQARDYRPLAIEPGVPMLDASAANSKILFRWIGELAAEPVWEGDSVNFYVCDHGGGRLVEVICQPAGQHELRSLLPDELALLKDRLEKARPETPMEQAFHKALLRTFNDLVNASRRAGLDSYFFRYRDVENRWRLVWCWGYQRIEEKPAPAVVCADPNCACCFSAGRERAPSAPLASRRSRFDRSARAGGGAACCWRCCCSCWRPGCWGGSSVPIAWSRSPTR